MTTLVIYDNTGYIYLQQTGTYRTPKGEINFLEVEIPEGKILNFIDTSVTPNVARFEDLPLSEIDILKQKIADQESAIVELASLVGGNV